MITLEHVTKKYGTFLAVNDVSLEVQRGEVFGFLGVNGAGKTTTLRMLAGILRPTAGKILIADYDVLEEPLLAKQVTGYIPDRPYIYEKLTAWEFLLFTADLYRMKRSEAEKRIEELLDHYGLKDWKHELVSGFSHGMKQRLVTCAAVLPQPKVLIIDEPMVGLDPHGAKLLKDSLRQYAKDGMSIMLSTHSLNVAEEVCDRLAIIHQGSILVSGSFQEIRSGSGSVAERLEELFLQLTREAVL